MFFTQPTSTSITGAALQKWLFDQGWLLSSLIRQQKMAALCWLACREVESSAFAHIRAFSIIWLLLLRKYLFYMSTSHFHTCNSNSPPPFPHSPTNMSCWWEHFVLAALPLKRNSGRIYLWNLSTVCENFSGIRDSTETGKKDFKFIFIIWIKYRKIST